MTFRKSLAQLQKWCAQSGGKPLPGLLDGRNVFQSRSIHTEAEMRVIEERLGCSLPDSYRTFMGTIGASSLFCTHVNGGGPIFYRPEEVIRASADAEVESDDGFVNRFCFVGEHRSMGDLMGFLTSRPGPRNFDVFCHEYPFEEYVSISDEINSWRTFDEWLVHAVETKGIESI